MDSVFVINQVYQVLLYIIEVNPAGYYWYTNQVLQCGREQYKLDKLNLSHATESGELKMSNNGT